MTICTHNLRKAWNRRGEAYANAFLKELFRLQRRQYVRGFAGDFRPTRKGGPRALLPIVATSGYGTRYPAREYRPMVSAPLDRV